jgi:RNA polymerase sigma-70 factor (ECF subfamily)
MQDVMIRLLRVGDDQEEAIENPSAYIVGIARHVLADYATEDILREKVEGYSLDSKTSEEKSNSGGSDDKYHHPTVDDVEKRTMLQQELEKLFALLPDMHARVLYLHKAEGYLYEEVAEELSLSIHTVEKYVTQSKSILREAGRDL